MDTKNIPNIFWYTVSCCMLVATIGVLRLAWKASSVTLSFADAKIELAGQIEELADDKAQLAEEKSEVQSVLNQAETMHVHFQNQAQELDLQRLELEKGARQLDQKRKEIQTQLQNLPEIQRQNLPAVFVPTKIQLPPKLAPRVRPEVL